MSTQTSIGEVELAIYNILKPSGTLDTTLAALGVTDVFDALGGVPINQPFPYITLGGGTIETPQNTFLRRGYDSMLYVHIWAQDSGILSANKGGKNSYAILAQLNHLLDRQPLTLASQSHIYTMYDQAIPMLDSDGLTQHIPCRYKIFCQE